MSDASHAPKHPHVSTDATAAYVIEMFKNQQPLTAPIHGLLTSPARSHPNAAHAKELPLHLIHLILSHLDHVGDLARITRTSRLFYYMALPRLYEHVTLRAYSEMRFVDGKPEGYGYGSPFAMGLNTLVSRNFSDYIRKFSVVGDWREHDVEDYKQGCVPDNSMVLQIAMRAALDRMKNLESFSWELNTPPLQTVYQGLGARTTLSSLTIRCQTRRIPRPISIMPPLPNLQTLVVYDIDPLCYPDDISLLLLGSKKLENLKLHWSPRMRAEGEESVNLHSMFGRCLTAKYSIPLKRLAIYNLCTRNTMDGIDKAIDQDAQTELTVINSGNTSDPITVFVDSSWKVRYAEPFTRNLKMIRTDNVDKEQALALGKYKGLECLYIISNRGNSHSYSKQSSSTTTPATPSNPTPSMSHSTGSASGTPNAISENLSRSLAGEYLAVIQTNHRTIRHLLLSDRWVLSDNALFRLCQSCPNLEQLGFSSSVPPLESLRQVFTLVPKLWAVRFLINSTHDSGNKSHLTDPDLNGFALATEFWRPEYKNVKYVGFGEDLIFKMGGVYFPSKGKMPSAGVEDNTLTAKMSGPKRTYRLVSRESVKHVEIWGMDTTEFDPAFP